jgi:hypothetical protein
VTADKPFSFDTDQGNKVEVVPTRLIHAGGLYLGLTAGYKSVNWFTEVGIYGDGALAGARINYTVQLGPGSQNYALQNSSYYHGHGYRRSTLTFGARFTGDAPMAATRKAKWQLWGLAGVHMLRRPPTTAESPLGGSWHFNDQDSMAYVADMLSPLRTSWYINGGLMIKGFNSKGHSILNISLFYGQALSRYRPMVISALRFKNYTDGKTYQNGIRSLGSGIYLQLSKDIYLNNLIKRKRAPYRGVD